MIALTERDKESAEMLGMIMQLKEKVELLQFQVDDLQKETSRLKWKSRDSE